MISACKARIATPVVAREHSHCLTCGTAETHALPAVQRLRLRPLMRLPSTPSSSSLSRMHFASPRAFCTSGKLAREWFVYLHHPIEQSSPWEGVFMHSVRSHATICADELHDSSNGHHESPFHVASHSVQSAHSAGARVLLEAWVEHGEQHASGGIWDGHARQRPLRTLNSRSLCMKNAALGGNAAADDHDAAFRDSSLGFLLLAGQAGGKHVSIRYVFGVIDWTNRILHALLSYSRFNAASADIAARNTSCGGTARIQTGLALDRNGDHVTLRTDAAGRVFMAVSSQEATSSIGNHSYLQHFTLNTAETPPSSRSHATCAVEIVWVLPLLMISLLLATLRAVLSHCFQQSSKALFTAAVLHSRRVASAFLIQLWQLRPSAFSLECKRQRHATHSLTHSRGLRSAFSLLVLVLLSIPATTAQTPGFGIR